MFTYHLPLRVLLLPEGGELKIEPTIILLKTVRYRAQPAFWLTQRMLMI